MYFNDWFKPIFPLFLILLLIPIVNFAHVLLTRLFVSSINVAVVRRRVPYILLYVV